MAILIGLLNFFISYKTKIQKHVKLFRRLHNFLNKTKICLILFLPCVFLQLFLMGWSSSEWFHCCFLQGRVSFEIIVHYCGFEPTCKHKRFASTDSQWMKHVAVWGTVQHLQANEWKQRTDPNGLTHPFILCFLFDHWRK